jgi:hopene-associated glycosyltransferase HpnB
MIEPVLVALAAAAAAAWCYLVFGHARFWLADQRLDEDLPAPDRWPAVAALVPARDEADVVARALGSLLEQDYPGAFRIILADDESRDDTAKLAAELAARHPRGERLCVELTSPRPEGWVGKMWALECGVARARRELPEAEFWWLTDADVAHSPGNLRRLVAKATRERLDLVSLMVRLAAAPGLERLLIPAFVYFFQMLYPFPAVNDPRRRTAGAAGGCMLVRTAALARLGGLAALRGEIIDDCALARAIKPGGPIWLGLTRSERSLRPYGGIRGVWPMVARSAFTQLRCSNALLAGTLVGLALLFAVPPLLVLGTPLHADPVASLLAAAAWLAMALSFAPTLAFYDRPLWWGLLLPLLAALYAGMTLDSARRHWRGHGAHWKGRGGAGRTATSGREGPAAKPRSRR